MLLPLYRLADRLGRVAVKSGIRFGESVRGRGRQAGDFGAVRANSKSAAGSTALAPGSTAPAGGFTLTARQMPVVALILLANAAVVIAATLAVEHLYWPSQAAAPTAVAVVAPPLTPPPVTVDPPGTPDSNNTIQIASIGVNVNPAPAGPTVTAPPNPLTVGGTIYYAYRHGGFTNLWAQVLGRPNPVRLTAGPWDDRDPAISPDGTRLAFASHREGSWNLYILDLTTGNIQRLTSGSNYKGNPKWSPDGQYLVFELYRNDNLDIAIIGAKGGNIIPLTADPAADYDPAWSPNGRQIVWVSVRSGNPELWTMSLDHPDERQYVQLTHAPGMQVANPAFSRNGDVVVYTDMASPYGVIWGHSATDPNAPAFEAGQGDYPTWSPEGSSLASVVVQESGPDYVLAAPLSQHGLSQIAFRAQAGHITGLAWSGVALPDRLPQSLAQLSQVSDAPLWNDVISGTLPAGSDPPYALVPLPNVTASDARLSERVSEAYVGLRVTTARAVGWDFLNTLDNALVGLDAPPPPSLDFNSWLKTGRAFDFAQAAEQFGWVKLTREDLGFHTYWRVWLLAAVQDGSQGEPLRQLPWNLAARYSGRPQPYDAGGEYASVLPPGYYVDFTMLADDYGWSRVPAESNWRQFYPGIMYWRFEHRDGLDWLAAMREVYSADAVATRTPVPSPTDTPTITQTPTPTMTWTRLPTRTPTVTPTRWPTITLSPSATHWPTITLTPSRTPRPTPTPKGTWYTATPPETPTETPPFPVDTGATSQP